MHRGEVFRLRVPKGVGHAQWLGKRVGRLAVEETWAVDDALATALGVD